MPGEVNITAARPAPARRRLRARRPPRRARDAGATRARLIDAAAEIFNRDGYHATDTNRIARAAGYAPASFYKHFRDKREIFLAAYAGWVAGEWAAIREEWARVAGGTRARRLVRRVLAHHRRWAGFRRSLRALAASDPVVRDFRRAQRGAQLVFLRGLVGGADSPARRSDDLWTLLVFERVCDAIADGDSAALGAAEERLLRRLEALVANPRGQAER
jgi:AcrR family transcriptional regulator